MEIVKMKISDIKPAKYNPRKDLKQGDREYDLLKKGIEEFGLVDPLIVNKRGNVLVGGHQRLKVLKQLGYEETEVSIVDLEPSKEKALNIALNKIGGDWDLPSLESILEELNLEDFDMELTGFDLDEIGEMLGEEKDFSSPEKETEELEGCEDCTFSVTVPKMHEERVKDLITKYIFFLPK